tara:strand:- start:1905 stop:2078 length:174 start_codon:yes stop_codon:yes gene_type:complete
MNDKISNNNDNSVESGRDATGSAQSGKSVWSEPTMTRLDVALTQTVFNTVPDGDTQS